MLDHFMYITHSCRDYASIFFFMFLLAYEKALKKAFLSFFTSFRQKAFFLYASQVIFETQCQYQLMERLLQKSTARQRSKQIFAGQLIFATVIP